MNKAILKIVLPAIVSNIIVPILGLIDLTIAGHIGDERFIGAVAVGATMFNLTYWSFGFLRMSTSGLTAQSVGAADKELQALLLCRSLLLALTLGVIITLLQHPIEWILLTAIKPGDEINTLARLYYDILVWGAPAMLATMSFTGWFLGMQNSTYPMAVGIAVNVINVCVSLLCVFPLRMGFAGIAVGTLVAQWSGAVMSLWFALRMFRHHELRLHITRDTLFNGIGRFFKISGDIFLRSVCIMLVWLWFTGEGARSGDLTLAVNSLFMQLYLLYSNFMDGFAFAGEAIVGRCKGAGDRRGMNLCVRRLFTWGMALTAVFSVAYGLLNEPMMRLFSDNAEVVAHAGNYRFWITLLPLAGMAAFIWDGVFIGLTETRKMLVSLAVSTALFFALDVWTTAIADSNHRLWLAYVVYLATRGAILHLFYRKSESDFAGKIKRN